MANYRRKTLIISPPAISQLGDDDLLAEVLCRLPDPRSAWRCKSVCKRWKSLISAPYFSRRFLSHHRNRSAIESGPSLLISSVVQGPIWSFLPLPSVDYRFVASVADCFRDLLLIEFVDRTGGSFHGDELSRSFLVCNPFTKQWVALPLAPKSCSKESAVRLVCKPCHSVTTFDLGAAGREEPFTHHSEYRFLVVRLLDRQSKLDVFCSISGDWTELALEVSIPRCHLFCDLEREEMELFVRLSNVRLPSLTRIYRSFVFQPKITLWPTPISNYEKLQSFYNGSYSCWLQHSNARGK